MGILALLGVGTGTTSTSITSGWHYASTQTENASSSSKSFTNYDVGGASASRVVVACYVWSHSLGATISAFTIGGVTATLVQNQVTYSVHGRIAMYYAVVPSGTTADVVVTMSTTIGSGTACSVFFGFPVTSTPLDSGVSTTAAGGLVTVSDIQIATGGILIGYAGGDNISQPWAFTWSGADTLTSDSESLVNITTWSTRHLIPTESSTTADMTSDPAGVQASALIAASWGA